MERISSLSGAMPLVLAIALLELSTAAAQAQRERVLYSFQGGLSDGAFTQAGVTMDSQGNFYGTTQAGGGTGCGGSGCGTVFKLTPKGKETLLHIFTEGTDGTVPVSGVVVDSAGNVYGTTFLGGEFGVGTVFKVTPAGKERLLHSFTGGDDGRRPVGDLIADSEGNLYGTTTGGGLGSNGVVFKMTPRDKETVLYSFAGGNDGSYPDSVLMRDATGNIYGTTADGGIDCDGSGQGCGTVFKITARGGEKVLYRFVGGTLGAYPAAGVVMDSAGNLYGTTNNGGVDCDGVGVGCGLLFKLTSNGKERVLHTFTGGDDGADPKGQLIMDAAENLYGTTPAGGAVSGECGCGVVFKVTHPGNEKIVHTFSGSDGNGPFAGLIRGTDGNFYGTTFLGGTSGDGTVFKLTKR